MTRDPIHEAKMICHQLRDMKSSGLFRFAAEGNASLLAMCDAADKSVDDLLADWKRLIEEGDEAKLIAGLNAYYAALRRQEEDEIIAQADAIKAARK